VSYIFKSERLGFRLLTAQDAPNCDLFWGNDEVMAYTGGSISAELLPQVIDFYAQSQQDYGITVYGVEDISSGQLIGAAGFDIESAVEDIELVFHFMKDAWGKGLASEAAVACIRYAAEVYQPKSIIASSSVENKKALNILGKIGFAYLGIHYLEDTAQDEALFQLVL